MSIPDNMFPELPKIQKEDVYPDNSIKHRTIKVLDGIYEMTRSHFDIEEQMPFWLLPI